MTIDLDKLKTALCSFMDTEIISKVPVGRKVLFGAATMALPYWVDDKFMELLPYLKRMGMGSEDGTLDLDRVEQELTKLMDKYGRLQISVLGRDIALDQSDVQKIADLCRKL